MNGTGRRLLLSLLAPILVLSLSEGVAGLRLKPFEARFQVVRNGLALGTLDIRFSLDAQGAYRYTGHTRPGAVIDWLISDQVHETSEGRYHNDRILPQSYTYLQHDDALEKRTRLDFDWSTGKVWTQSEGKRWAQDLPAGTQDKYSQQLALRLDLADGKREVSYPVADGGTIKTYRYQVVGEDAVDLPYGRLECLRIRRSKASKPPDYTIWIAPGLDYLPVKIERQRSSALYVIELMQLRET